MNIPYILFITCTPVPLFLPSTTLINSSHNTQLELRSLYFLIFSNQLVSRNNLVLPIFLDWIFFWKKKVLWRRMDHSSNVPFQVYVQTYHLHIIRQVSCFGENSLIKLKRRNSDWDFYFLGEKLHFDVHRGMAIK